MIELDPKNFWRAHNAFLRLMHQNGHGVKFENFGHRFFVADETPYKTQALKDARDILKQAK